ncbi:uncharacterized protein K452DRAFT_202984, partial [Aplosporella prunicola CBS 121167]
SNGTLNSNSVRFWTGQNVGWEGIVTVDGISYEWLGTGLKAFPIVDEIKSATPLTVSYDSQYSNFTFAAGPVQLTASFFSPVTPHDLCRTSIPLSYLQVSYLSTDNSSHSVQFYGDVDDSWNNYAASAAVNYDLYADAQTVGGNEYDFSETNDFPNWGDFAYSTTAGTAVNFTHQAGDAVNLRYNFLKSHQLTNVRDNDISHPVFAYAHDFGNSNSGSALYTVGTIQAPQINLLTSEGLQSLPPWWASPSCYGPDQSNLIAFHYADFHSSQGMAAQFETQLKADVNNYYATEGVSVSSNAPATPAPAWASAGMDSSTMDNFTRGVDQFGEAYIFDSSNAYGFLNPNDFSGVAVPDLSEAQAYYSIVALSARQIMGAYTLTVPPNFNGDQATRYNSSEPFMFQKEISSNGNMNTVDVLYPAMPFFLWANPDLLRYALNPLYLNQESGFYPKDYSMHDLGTHFPNATGHVPGDDEAMPVEESGNMLLMSYSIYKFTGEVQWLRDHYSKLYQWAQFLIEYALIPSEQLSTDDFLGTLENQTNLAIKGIVGLQAMAGIASVTDHLDDAANFSATAANYYSQWEGFAIDPSGTHTVLAYQWRSSWGQLYNAYPDKLLNLGVVTPEVYAMQSDWYDQVSQVFGVPLDNRHSLTKSDWEMWTAATCKPHTRRLMVNALAYWLNQTSTDKAFTDLYETIDTGSYPSQATFIARPVAGGHFALLALLRAGATSA